MSLSDSELIARVLLADDHHAFTELVRRHQSALRGLLRKLTRGNEVLADELAQETFLRAYRSLKQYRGDAKFSTWLHRIACNAFQSDVRRAKPHETLDAHESELAENPAIDRIDLQHDIEEAMKILTEPERAAVTLCYTSGLTHEEAADVLRLPLGTVKTNILTAKQKLRRYLLPWQNRSVT